MIQQKLFYDISLFEAPITIHFFVDANTSRNQEFIYCWSDDLHFMLKTFQLRRICNGPCISLFFLSTQSSTFLERAGIFSRWTDTDFFLFFGFALLNTMTYSHVPIIFVFCYDWTDCHGAYVFECHSQKCSWIWTEQWQAGVAKLSLWGTPYLLLEEISQKLFNFREYI